MPNFRLNKPNKQDKRDKQDKPNKLKKHLIWLAAACLLTLVVFLFFSKVKKSPVSQLKKNGPYNFILISVDTLRADRIGCYGFNDISTPTMDLFASKGIKFENCIAQTPLTLPSHTSLLTGTYPTFHGVRDNGGFLVPEQLTTLAELFKDAGYQTAAFVASYVLDSKWGLNQGFDFYFDSFDLSKYKTISLGNIQRPAGEVIDEVLAWFESRGKEKFFTWIHLYDPHTPYEPPSPFREQYPGRPYLGEIAYTDYQLERLWRYLEKNDLLSDTIIVFASDHGESLGEHQESTHGFFVYQAAVHVPLIFITPENELQGLSSSPVVGLVDIMPTIVEIAGLSLPAEAQGESLLPLFRDSRDNKTRDKFMYTETFYPRFHYGWSELKSIQDKRYKLIVAPRLELYDLQEDPNELHNLVDNYPGITRDMVNMIEKFIEETSKGAYEIDYTHIDEETRQKLTALGYIGSFTKDPDIEGRKLGDPKDKIRVFNSLSEAKELGLQGQFDRAVSLVESIIEDDPEVIDAYFTLGNIYYRAREFDKALESFHQALKRNPTEIFTIINIANCHIMKGEFTQAEEFLLEKLPVVPPDSQVYFILGNVSYALKKYDEAEKYYKECLRLNPSSASAYSSLGGIYVIKDRLKEAEESLKKAQKINPKLERLHYYFAQLHEKRNELTQAMEAYKKELEIMPHNFRASFNLARLYRIKGETSKEEEYLQMTLESNPRFPLTYFYLARIYLNKGEKYEEAVALVKKGIELEPEKEELPLGYFLLADLYNRLGDDLKSAEYARRGQKIVEETKKAP